MVDHAGLGESEGEKGADGEERNEAVGNAAEDDEKRRGEADERDDAVRVEQAPSADHEDMREEVVHGDGAGEAREVGIGGVGGEREHGEDGGRADVVEPAASGDGRDELREDALVAGMGWVGGIDVVSAAELSASRPKTGMPAMGPMCSARSSEVARGLPATIWKRDISTPAQHDSDHSKGYPERM